MLCIKNKSLLHNKTDTTTTKTPILSHTHTHTHTLSIGTTKPSSNDESHLAKHCHKCYNNKKTPIYDKPHFEAIFPTHETQCKFIAGRKIKLLAI